MPVTPITLSFPSQLHEVPESTSTHTPDIGIIRAAEGLVPPGSPFEDIIKNVFRLVATQEEEAIKLRSLSLEAEQLWRESLLHKLGASEADAAHKTHQHNLSCTFSRVIEPLPMISAGVLALLTGAGVPLSLFALCSITIGALISLDSALGEPTKRALASSLARGESESSQNWLHRIHVATGIVSLACNIGLSLGTHTIATQGITEIITYATSMATNVSNVAAQGAQIVTKRRVDKETALVIEIEEELRSSDRKLKEDLATLKRLQGSVKSLFQILESSMKSRLETSSRILGQ